MLHQKRRTPPSCWGSLRGCPYGNGLAYGGAPPWSSCPMMGVGCRGLVPCPWFQRPTPAPEVPGVSRGFVYTAARSSFSLSCCISSPRASCQQGEGSVVRTPGPGLLASFQPSLQPPPHPSLPWGLRAELTDLIGLSIFNCHLTGENHSRPTPPHTVSQSSCGKFLIKISGEEVARFQQHWGPCRVRGHHFAG